MVVDLDRIVAALDELFALDASAPDTAMSRHLPRVYDKVGTDWRAFVEPHFAQRFNGLMRRGHPTVRTVYGACFPSAEVVDAWLAVAERGDLLVTHHPIDVRNGSPEDDTWAEGFVPIDATQLKAITERELSMYACHAPMDTSLRVGTAAAIVEALSGTVVNQFWPYGDGHAGLVADIPTISSNALVRRAREIFAVDTVEVEGAVHDAVTRIAVVGGIGDHVEQMALAERMGAQAYLTGELHVRIEGDYGRRKFAAVQAFAANTGMTLIGVSHAASEHLVIETQLARWFAQNHRITLRPIREPRWWR
ncbi:Nif3-like dinuclear metal center hexameric protein [Micromonospora sp. RTP1Z1]|uniref:Nif3-like dinuclear metal center hexameric protein n=1 Tax=Micromonospora sp. RTP1Z1 TaxID=2994043 RepID=UPI0029C961B9|nr:Nif3-like dinuclear metal center hexameric protein [Micromonospora sp. RTP1Z1]